MKLKDFIKKTLSYIPENFDAYVEFNVHVDTNMEVNNKALNVIRFSVKKK